MNFNYANYVMFFTLRSSVAFSFKKDLKRPFSILHLSSTFAIEKMSEK